MAWRLSIKAWGGFVLALALLAALSFYSYRRSVRSLDDARWVAHTQEVLSALNNLRADGRTLETERRGYALTGADSLLERYRRAAGQIAPDLARLRALTADNPAQAGRLDALAPALQARIARMDRAVQARQDRPGDLQGQARFTLEGTAQMEPILELIRGMAHEEERLLALRQHEAAASARAALWIIGAGSLAGFLLLGATAWLGLSQMNARIGLQLERDRLFHLSMDMLCIAGFDGRFKDINPAWESTLGYSTAELKEMPFLDFVHPEDRERTAAQSAKLAAGETVVFFDNRYLCKDGSYKWLSWSASPVPDERLIYAVARDVTERKNLERMKEDFIAVTTHELRTPLAAIDGPVNAILHDPEPTFSADTRKLLEMAARNCARMTRLVNDFLFVAKLEAGHMPFHLEPVEFATFLPRVIEENAGYARARGVSMKLAGSVPAGVQAVADPDRLTQVMANFLSNAAKFTPDGGEVTVSLSREAGRLRVAVSDRGPGIPEDFRPMVFEKFAQARQPRGGPAGTGLGLSVSKAIMEKLGGTIGFEPRPGGGTTFFFELPELAA